MLKRILAMAGLTVAPLTLTAAPAGAVEAPLTGCLPEASVPVPELPSVPAPEVGVPEVGVPTLPELPSVCDVTGVVRQAPSLAAQAVAAVKSLLCL